MNRDVLFSMDFFECLGGIPSVLRLCFFAFSSFSFFVVKAWNGSSFSQGRYSFFFPSFFLSLSRQERERTGLEGGNLSVWEAGGKTFSDIVSVGIPVERVKP